MIVSFTKSSLPNGWLGNMSPYPIEWEGKTWKTAEALFQALRFDDDAIREEIRAEKSPLMAKAVAKKNAHLMSFTPLSDKDLENMDLVLRSKIEQHPELKQQLIETGDAIIIEDIGKRAFQPGNHTYWGASLQDGVWIGHNKLGQMWMIIRDSL